MYLKSIEVQGFKSFANKIVFDFHNGITGIVGPNGSGKSNVADAVRWVLGEQSAKQLRGASMQDVIFAGTENRKPLSYAYVAITMDNSDHQLAIDFEEVTVARRVYRSGESECLINGNPCRLKDVTELFYDTGIGKEGYSIIGQGQIERILSGKPEERRELFDEAAGIVKYKKRKATAQKKLENERENLVRVNDILAELERQVGPLERQAEKARVYLKKKEELKTYDVNMFLLEVERIDAQLKEVQDKFQIADRELKDANEAYESAKSEYEKMEQDMALMDEKITTIRENLSNSTVMKGKLEGQINVLNEQIHTAEMTDEHLKSRLDSIDREKEERLQSKASYDKEKEELDVQLKEVEEKKEQATEHLRVLQEEIARCTEGIEKGKNEIIELLNKKASVKARQQRFDTMLEQVNIRKAQLTQRLLARKTEEADLESVLSGYQKELDAVNATIQEKKREAADMEGKERTWKKKSFETNQQLEEAVAKYHKEQSRLESLKNIAERYDGYGNSIRRVMEQKAQNKGLLGVVSDLIQVEKKYEIAIETALGGNIQNIVTEDEETAKRMIAYLKQNRFGRATFLPLTSVDGKGNFKNADALNEKGVIGLANTLVKTDKKYEGVTAYLLGRVIVTEDIDCAVTLARKYHYSLHIVTLEGEYLSPGGSMTGGAFKNSSNLLARKREIEELEKTVAQLENEIKEHRNRLEDIKTARALLAEDIEKNKADLQEQYILQNTAKMNVERVAEQKNESESVFAGLQLENQEIENQLREISENKERILQEIEAAKVREQEIEEENIKFQASLDENSGKEEAAQKAVSEVQLEEAGIRQKAEFVLLNLERINGEIKRYEDEREGFLRDAEEAKKDAEKKRHDIEEIKKTILASDDTYANLEKELKENLAHKDEMSTAYKGFFQKREEIGEKITALDKEIFRLNSQREKLEEAHEYQNNYMWEEYELTLHAALELRNEEYTDLAALKKMIASIKDDIRKLGDVNVNAIEDYKEVSERYEFLKTQHDDLVEAEKTLMGIIEELDTGMRKQFMEKFAEIQREFDKVFKELFGGGKGTLELVEDEDILECGIRIIAQPPGKKLQNMMQMSGGEKSLTAIALLFAIQNLKPSPFCLLDEIEAALDDSNVGRFAKYLHKLTKNTQFIVITHRRGTMAAADRLYGITMQEKGVSTLVSVNLIEGDLDK
ncbi:MAG: chromosome segregation protein SMC [Clostridiales bacterium]|nr:chromosome segregation protein SMC [Clostridiales bacterium]MDY4112090.1 chromosome segregation protein SMC [Roseburia sp.]